MTLVNRIERTQLKMNKRKLVSSSTSEDNVIVNHNSVSCFKCGCSSCICKARQTKHRESILVETALYNERFDISVHGRIINALYQCHSQGRASSSVYNCFSFDQCKELCKLLIDKEPGDVYDVDEIDKYRVQYTLYDSHSPTVEQCDSRLKMIYDSVRIGHPIINSWKVIAIVSSVGCKQQTFHSIFPSGNQKYGARFIESPLCLYVSLNQKLFFHIQDRYKSGGLKKDTMKRISVGNGILMRGSLLHSLSSMPITNTCLLFAFGVAVPDSGELESWKEEKL